MIITCRTLTGQKFTVNGEGTDTVKQLKESILKEKGDAFPVEHQKLIYSGKVMVDDQTLEHYGVNESGFVVVMATKPKPAPAAAAASGTAATSESAAAPAADKSKTDEEGDKKESATDSSASAAAAVTNTTAPASTTTTTTTSSSSSSSATTTAAATQQQQQSTVERENSLLHGEQYEAAVSNLVNMGFPRQQVQQAMQASFNNPDRAADYLLSGNIPSVSQQQQEQQQQQQQAGSDEELMSIGGESVGTGGARSRFVDQLRQWPQFQMLRRMVAQDQSVLPTLLQQIGQSNPQLLQEIQANQEEFLAFLNESPDDEDEEGEEGEEAIGDEQQQQQRQQQRQPQQTLLRVTVQERAAIDRLKDLGFPEHMVIEAYFACDKNEDAAANFLLNEGFDNDN